MPLKSEDSHLQLVFITVTKVGIAFSSEERRSAEGRLLPEGRKNITDWRSELRA